MTIGYQNIPIIRDIEIAIKRGEIFTLIGPNGAGKTTMIKSIVGQLKLLDGTIYLNKESMEELSGKELAKKMAVVLTDQVKTELFTCEDMVATGRYPYTGRFGILTKKDLQYVEEAMECVHVSELKDRDFREISDGQKQRVMLARAICQKPEILILDEPTSYLDIRYKLDFMSALQQMTRKENITVILSLHELDLAERISDKIMCVRGEYVERVGTPEEIFQKDYIRSLYGIEKGSFDEEQGRLELPKITGDPKVFVLAGGGKGASVYRALQRKGIPFATGILQENDVDYPVSKALAQKVISQKSFTRISEETYLKAKQQIDQCEKVYCAIQEFGELNMENYKLMEYAKELGKLVE
ncbi:MAG: ABC transporter ATP-binding protein [Lachnospiraceae bacterium]|nr:ABC transporter ATP-binding protein [Lachnospiraceae bacterium]